MRETIPNSPFFQQFKFQLYLLLNNNISMKKTIRLTESDLMRIVKKVIKENEEMDFLNYRSPIDRPEGKITFTSEELNKIKDEVLRLNNPGFFEPYELETYLDGITNNLYGENQKAKNKLINWLKSEGINLYYA
jgi:hypothetical protein